MPYGRAYAQSRGSFLSGLASGVLRVGGAVARGVLNTATGGVAGGVINAMLPRPTAPVLRTGQGQTVMPGGAATTTTTRAGKTLRVGVSPLGTIGVRQMGGGRRMNAGNAKAARRAIRRIKSVRKLLQSIERELPRRPAAHGSRGVITAREAMRALKA